MKKILEIIYSLLIGLIGEDVSEEVTAALAELKKGIDELSDETKSEEEIKEVENRIQTQLNDLLPKMETTANKTDLAKLKNQFAKFQESLLDEAVKNFGANQKPLNESTKKVHNGIPYESGKRDKLLNLITMDEDLIPVFVEQQISATISENMDFMGELDYRGNHNSATIPVDIDADDEEDDRAGVWPGVSTEKKKMILNLIPKKLTTQALYQLAGISWEDLKFNNGMLPKYRVLKTLKRWREEYMRAVVIGDGRAVENVRHITSLVPIKRAVTDAYCTVVSPGVAPTIKSVRALVTANLKRSSEAWLVANATTINLLQEISTTTGIVTYMSDEELAKALKIKKVYTHDKMADGEIAIFRNYEVIGIAAPSTISDYDILTNTDFFEVIGMVGGDLASVESALWIDAPEAGTISADPATQEFVAAGEDQDITVTASSEYEITSKPAWITGSIDDDTCTLTAAASSVAARSGAVVFALTSDADVNVTITVTQLTGL